MPMRKDCPHHLCDLNLVAKSCGEHLEMNLHIFNKDCVLLIPDVLLSFPCPPVLKRSLQPCHAQSKAATVARVLEARLQLEILALIILAVDLAS